jgi:hypothetical protein
MTRLKEAEEVMLNDVPEHVISTRPQTRFLDDFDKLISVFCATFPGRAS